MHLSPHHRRSHLLALAAISLAALTISCAGARAGAADPSAATPTAALMDPCGPEPFWTAERRAELTASIRGTKLSWTDRTAEIAGAEMDRIAAERAGICGAMVAQKAPEEAQEKVGLCLRAGLLRQWALYEALKAPRVDQLVELDHILGTAVASTQSCRKDEVWLEYDGQLTDQGLFKAQELSAIAVVYRTLDDERAEEATALALAAAEASGSKAMKIGALLGTARYAAGEQSDYPRANALASQALALAEAEGWTLARARAQEGLANVALHQGRYAEAETLYQSSLRTIERIYSHESMESAWSLDALGDVHKNSGNTSKAAQLYGLALKRCLQATTSEHHCATIVAGLATTLTEQGQYEAALTHYNRLLKQVEARLGPTHPDTAALHNLIGAIYHTRGDLDQALSRYNKALALVADVPGLERRIAFAHARLGDLRYSTKEYRKSLEHYQSMLSATIKSLGPDHLDVAHPLLRVARAHLALGDHKSAIEHQVKAYKIATKALGPEHHDIASIHSQIGKTLADVGEYDAALKHHQRSLAINLNSLGPNHPSTAESRAGVGVALFHTGHRAEAVEFLKEALAIRTQTLGTEHPDTAGNHASLASVYQAQGELALALEHYRHVLDTLRRILPDDQDSHGFFLQHIQQLCDAGHAPACHVR